MSIWPKILVLGLGSRDFETRGLRLALYALRPTTRVSRVSDKSHIISEVKISDLDSLQCCLALTLDYSFVQYPVPASVEEC